MLIKTNPRDNVYNPISVVTLNKRNIHPPHKQHLKPGNICITYDANRYLSGMGFRVIEIFGNNIYAEPINIHPNSYAIDARIANTSKIQKNIRSFEHKNNHYRIINNK